MGKIHANASRHSALSHGHIEKIEVQLKAEVQNLLEQAEKADQSDLPDGISLPEELKCRQDRLAVMEQAKAKIEARVAETGKKPGGKLPKPPEEGPRASDQINLTDEDSRIVKVAGGGFDQCYNAQAAVACESMLVVATGLVQARQRQRTGQANVGGDRRPARQPGPG